MVKIKQVIPQDYCLKCLGCCRFAQQNSCWLPSLLNAEIDKLIRRYIPPVIVSSEKSIIAIPSPRDNNYVCPFLSLEDNKCKIYDLRPFECQLYPFLIHKNKGEIFLSLDLRCPFAKENRVQVFFKEYEKYLTAILQDPEAIKTFEQNPQIAKAYPDVLNLAELKI